MKDGSLAATWSPPPPKKKHHMSLDPKKWLAELSSQVGMHQEVKEKSLYLQKKLAVASLTWPLSEVGGELDNNLHCFEAVNR